MQNHQSIINHNENQSILFSVKISFNWNFILPNPTWIFSGGKKFSFI
ncbi:hypothetical protein NU08_1504 [Flavobacterium anhuiense]|uniref:Uncharacterized protein n=1 Tax=Flavobacterium anhuiense TaxID=459526 RepID=A0A444W0F4_9FLAO|nr:hypothetical protein NU08_1504 [Flavobacterium anhuiense]